MSIYLWLGLILIGVGLVIYFLYKKESKPEPHDTYYFCTYNENGEKSCNHDSGIKPSLEKTIVLYILKTEYNDGKEHTIREVKKVMVGAHYKNMKEARIMSIDDLIDIYKVTIELP